MINIKVTKRNGKKEPVMLDKVLDRINQQTYGLDPKYIQPFEIAQKVIDGITPDIETRVLDKLAMETAAALTSRHPDYAILAARIAITSLHKETKKSFSETVKDLYKYVDPNTRKSSPVVSLDFYKIVMDHADELDSAIVHSRDHNFDYFGFKVLERSYLLKLNGGVAERPQYMYMRTAIQIWKNNIPKVIETYNLLSEGLYTHATPTLFNSGTSRPQLSSCFVAGTKVFTLSGPKNIEDVKIGDEVVTHLGNVKNVTQLHKNKLEDRKIFNVKILGTPSIKVTDNHKFFSITREQLEWGQSPKFNSIEYLRKGDYVSIPKKNVEKGPSGLSISIPISGQSKFYQNNFIIDEDFSFLIGILLGLGLEMDNKKEKLITCNNEGIEIAIDKENHDLIKVLINTLSKVFNCDVVTISNNNSNLLKIKIESLFISRVLGRFGLKFTEYGFNYDTKIPDIVYKWDAKIIMMFIKGIVKSGVSIVAEGKISFLVSNSELAKSLFSLFRNNGIMCYIDDSNYSISFDVNEFGDISHAENSIIEINGNKFIQISDKYIEKDLNPEFVYTLGIEDDHSYVVEGVVVENCFLLDVESDSIEGIFNTLKESAQISKNAGGIGIAFSKIRGRGTYISGTNGTSNGIVPFLKIYNEMARAVDQGGGKRKGSVATYIEPWHSDIFDFLELRKNQGKEELRARDLFLALWTNDLFMERVDLDEEWTLMCPHECPGLIESYGEDFRNLYLKYEKSGYGKKTIKARELWNKILESQVETGTPYMLYKDTINDKSNQSNIGIIKSSNLCAEIVQCSGITAAQEHILKDEKLLESLGLSDFYGKESVSEIAVCNLASISLPRFVNKNKSYAFNKLYDVAYKATVNLNNVIDVNYYPTDSAKFSNFLHRPIGLGVQGLADVFFTIGIAYDSEEAKILNKQIFETIYFAAMRASCDLAKVHGPYATYNGSPISKGKFQFDLWGVTPTDRWDWNKLREDISQFGVRNSLTTCVMPTASTSSIFGNEASFESQTSNLYVRRVISGEFIILNKYLVKELVKINMWNDSIKNKIVAQNGSIQSIPEIPKSIKDIFKTVWEIKQKDVIDMAADRGAFIDQTQSMNIFMDNVNFAKLTSMHFYGWGRRSFINDSNGNPIIPTDIDCQVVYDKSGNPKFYRDRKFNLKTGMYYLRTKSAADAVKFTVQKEETFENPIEDQMNEISCSLDNPDCLSCGS